MIRVWKEVLCRGRQRDRTGRWFQITGRDIANAQRNAARLLSRGYPIPCVWEHQNVEATDPEERKARYAKFTFGHVVGQRVNDRGNLDLCHELRDPADAEQLAKTRFVSPKLYRGYSDPKGGEYRGTTIAHVAATPTPVQFWQRPFQLSRDKALYLSYTPGDAMADDTDKGDKGSDTPAANGKKTLADVIEALRESGMNIPDEVTDEAGLIIAIKAGAGTGSNDDDDGLGDLDASGSGAGDVAGAGSPPMLMSMTDPKVKAWAKNERIDAKRRVKALFSTGRVDRPTAQKLLRQVDSVELSYKADGDLVANPVLMKIAAYEELPKNAAWSPNGRRDATELSDTRQVDQPSDLSPGAGLDTVVKEQERLASMFSTAKK